MKKPTSSIPEGNAPEKEKKDRKHGPEKEKKDRKHGPEKEKFQLTIRIDKDIMDLAYVHLKTTNTRVTDLVERGMILAMREEDQELPALTSQVRFLVANTTKTEQDQLRDYLTFLRADEVRKPSEIDQAIRRFIREYLKTFSPLRDQVRKLYERYGRTEAEIEKLTG